MGSHTRMLPRLSALWRVAHVSTPRPTPPRPLRATPHHLTYPTPRSEYCTCLMRGLPRALGPVESRTPLGVFGLAGEVEGHCPLLVPRGALNFITP